MPDQLPPDPDAVKKWEQLPQNKPSKQAMPPIAGGGRWLWGLLILSGLIALGLLLLRGPG